MTRRTQRITSRNVITLDGNIADTFYIDMESTVQKVKLVNVWPGHLYAIYFSQDFQGRHVFTWPVNCVNALPVNPTPHSRSRQCFIGNAGNIWQAIAPGGW